MITPTQLAAAERKMLNGARAYALAHPTSPCQFAETSSALCWYNFLMAYHFYTTDEKEQR